MPSEEFRWYAIKLVIICSLIFVLQNIFQDFFENFVLFSSKILAAPWTIITYIFLHGNFSHLFFNMFALALFGSILEKIIGYKKFLVLFLVSGIFSGIASIFFYDAVMGASGAIFGILGTLAILRPKMTVWVMYVPMPMIVAIIFWGFLDIIGFFSPDGIAHIGHLVGLFFGIIFGIKLRKKYKIPEKPKEKRIVISEEEFRKWEEKYMKKPK